MRRTNIRKSSPKSKKVESGILSMMPQFSLSESYMSLLLGVVVVIFAAILSISFIKSRAPRNVATVQSETITQTVQKPKQEVVAKFASAIVVKGDTLWSIAEKNYKSGFEWVKIAKANNIANPETIEVGTKLVLPDIIPTKILATSTNIQIEKAAAVTQTKPISGDTYTIQHGDDLWDIAVRAYGDGYKWPEIAKANNLENPGLIHSDNVLKIPR